MTAHEEPQAAPSESILEEHTVITGEDNSVRVTASEDPPEGQSGGRLYHLGLCKCSV